MYYQSKSQRIYFQIDKDLNTYRQVHALLYDKATLDPNSFYICH